MGTNAVDRVRAVPQRRAELAAISFRLLPCQMGAFSFAAHLAHRVRKRQVWVNTRTWHAPNQVLELVRWMTKQRKQTGERSEPSEKKFYIEEFFGCAEIDPLGILLLDFLPSNFRTF